VRKAGGLWGPVLHQGLVAAVVVLVGVGAFGLGRLTAIREQKTSLRIYVPEGMSEATPTPKSANNTITKPVSSDVRNFVASKNGSKYYPAGCAGASRIQEANQIWFETAAAALAAGYSLSAGCTQ